jgi:hypothetical protein
VKRPIPGHHIVYGVLSDYLNGEELADTDDERTRQQITRMLVEEKGYAKNELEARLTIETTFNSIFVRSTIDLTVSVEGKRLFLLRYGPGSLVTREKSALAAARVLDPDYRIPYVVVTNGRDAEFLETEHGKVLATGMDGIPDRTRAGELRSTAIFEPYPDPRKREQALRILNAFDLEVCCRGDSCKIS